MSSDTQFIICDIPLMAISNDEAIFNNALCARVQELRKRRGWNQEQMAMALGVPVARYSKYETRSPLPAYLLERFCLIVDCSLENLVLGKPQMKIPDQNHATKQA